jgi:5-deoxy-glucuronate isomerase
MKYHAYLTARPGLNTPPYNPCKLLDFGLLKLSPGETYTAESGDREILAVLMGGKATFDINGKCFEKVGGRPNPFNGKPHSVYIPAGCRFSILGDTAVEIALPSAPSDETGIQPYMIAPAQVANGFWGAANFKRGFHQILTLASQPDLPAWRLIVGETFTPSGNWSTYPPHKHQVDDLPREAYHEEMYYFKVSFGICHYYNEADKDHPEGEEENFTVRDNSIHMMPRGYHTVVSAPGYTTYYLWFLAGNQRVQATVDDPQVGWVSRTVAMLKELGH